MIFYEYNFSGTAKNIIANKLNYRKIVDGKHKLLCGKESIIQGTVLPCWKFAIDMDFSPNNSIVDFSNEPRIITSDKHRILTTDSFDTLYKVQWMNFVFILSQTKLIEHTTRTTYAFWGQILKNLETFWV